MIDFRETLAVLLIAVLTVSGVGFSQDEADDEDFGPYPVVETGDTIIAPPTGVDPFYTKYLNANGVVIVGSGKVSDAAFYAARKTILELMRKRPDVNAAMLKNHPRISIMAFSETASDLPEFGERSDGEWGLGQMPGSATSLIWEKGIAYEGNTQYIANFLLHEFVHMVHNLAMPETDPEALDEIYAAYLAAVEEGRFMKSPNESERTPTPFNAWRDETMAQPF